jgi:hypothetical protein
VGGVINALVEGRNEILKGEMSRRIVKHYKDAGVG